MIDSLFEQEIIRIGKRGNYTGWDKIDIRLFIDLVQYMNPSLNTQKIADDFGFPNAVMVSRKLKAMDAAVEEEWTPILDRYVEQYDFQELGKKFHTIENAVASRKRVKEYCLVAKSLKEYALGLNPSVRYSESHPDDQRKTLTLLSENEKKSWTIYFDGEANEDSGELFERYCAAEFQSLSKLKFAVRRARLFMIPSPGPRGNLEGEQEGGAAKISLAFVNRKIFEGQKKKYKILQDIVQEKNLVLVAPFEYSLLLLDNESGKVVEEAELSF